MFKRIVCVLLLLCCFMSVACADYRYVYNGSQWDARLNLREQPSKNSSSLGRYYTGVRVQVLEDLGTWCRVRIAMGESETAVEGYMMSSYLRSDLRGVGQLPYVFFNGRYAYVMAYNSSNLHLLYENGDAGYVYTSGASLSQPHSSQQLVLERICTPERGVTLKDGDGQTVALLYGGVVLEGMIFAGHERALAALGDENDEVHGILYAGEWTWMDNGANCEEQYTAYEGDGGLVEVLGRMADGRTILRLTQNGEDAPQIVLSSGFHLTDLTSLQREGSYFRYTRPLAGQMTDSELVSSVYSRLGQEKLSALAGSTPVVERMVDFQYGHHMLRVKFVNVYGEVVGVADVDGAVMIWQDEDNG